MIALFGIVLSFLTPSVNFVRRTSNVNMIEPYDLVKNVAKIKSPPIGQLSYNKFIESIKNVDVAAIVEDKNVAILHDNLDHLNLYRYLPENSNDVINTLIKNHVDFQVFDISNQGFQLPFLVQIISLIIVFNIFSFFFQRNSPGGDQMAFMRKKNDVDLNLNVNTTFADVAGIPEAKEELYEIVDFLKNPSFYGSRGAKIPSGILLEGAPGTGKTLLARAVAGEANVNFISASGSQFVEMFVGVGAQRVRALFEKAKQNAPCVIFIDEIDAIGGKRGYGFNSGGNDEREQTLNQILTNMDGFDKTEGIIVLAATNRIDTLDPALLRSGRFDRKVKVSLPSLLERIDIAKIHFRNKYSNFSYTKLAELTSGFSGADLENLANEAAILSIRDNKTVIDNDIILKSFEKTTIGLPKKYDSRSKSIRRVVALHEAGHAIVIKHFSNYFNLQKVTINSNTAGAGGYCLFTPKDFYMEYPTKGFYIARIVSALGGRAAEMLYSDNNLKQSEVPYSTVTTGASGDLIQATDLCNKYIDLFESLVVSPSYSDNWVFAREKRVKELIDQCLNDAIDILKQNRVTTILLRNSLLANVTVSF